MLKQFENLIEEAKEEEYSNPLAPSSYPQYGTELDVKYCSFYLKTGACRFGERCSRHHMKPPSSDTILLPAMFQHISLGEDFTNDLDTDSGLEHEESDTDKSFADFFWDVFPEFQAIGQVTMFKVCCNHDPHLRGNVYVQYREEHEAVKAYAKFNGRFYASRQISCEFVKIEKWKSAICGQFHRMRCPKGKHCNFLHVFKNPGGLFMVHGSEVSANLGRVNLSSKGENAVKMLDNHPIVQAARAKMPGFHQGVTSRQSPLPNISPRADHNPLIPRRGDHHAAFPARGPHHSPCQRGHTPNRGRFGSSPNNRGRFDSSPSNIGRFDSSPSNRGRFDSSPMNRGKFDPSPHRVRHTPSPVQARSSDSPHRSGSHRRGDQDGGSSRRYKSGRSHRNRSRSPHSKRSSRRSRSRSPKRKRRL